MSVAKTGAIPNSYRQIHIAVDDFENRILKGRINHESKEYGIVFYSLSEMVFALEELFEEIHYPMKSVDHRNFSKKEYLDLKEESREVRIARIKVFFRGKLADFCFRTSIVIMLFGSAQRLTCFRATTLGCYVARTSVAGVSADKCEIQFIYAIGVAQPTSVMVDTFGTGKIADDELVKADHQISPRIILKNR